LSDVRIGTHWSVNMTRPSSIVANRGGLL